MLNDCHDLTEDCCNLDRLARLFKSLKTLKKGDKKACSNYMSYFLSYFLKRMCCQASPEVIYLENCSQGEGRRAPF